MRGEGPPGTALLPLRQGTLRDPKTGRCALIVFEHIQTTRKAPEQARGHLRAFEEAGNGGFSK